MKELNILVMVKQVPDPERNLRTTAEGAIDREKTPSVMNRYCRNAVEEALDLKDKPGAEVTVISMGPPKAELVLREAISMGADRGILLSDRRLAGSDTWATAYALGKACEHFAEEFSPFDIIFTGIQTTDGDTAHVGPQLAERLGIHVVAYSEHVRLKRDRTIVVKRVTEGGCTILRIKKLPALLTVTGTGNEPREATLKGLIRSKRAEILTWTVDDIGAEEKHIGMKGSPTTVSEVKKVEYTRPPCQMLRTTPGQAVTEMFTRMETDKKMEVWH